jgi:hypothetical protein
MGESSDEGTPQTDSFSMQFQSLAGIEAKRGSAFKRCRGFAPWFAIAFAFSCVSNDSPIRDASASRVGTSRYQAIAPSADEQYCGWFGEARDGVLYFGQSAFWSEFHRNDGDPRGDLETTGPQQVGRFDLAREEFLAPLEVPGATSKSGIWDVLPHPNGRIYFTSYFETAGYVDSASGRVVQFDGAGVGLNELALGPRDSILASRYGGAIDPDGSVVELDVDGRVLQEMPLRAPEGMLIEPKTVAYDAFRRQIWVTTDLLMASEEQAEGQTAGLGAAHHPTVILTTDGREIDRIDDVEVQFVRFRPDGTGYLAILDGTRLELAVLAGDDPDATLATATRIPLDSAFPRSYDFVQDLTIGDDGHALVTRWSGVIHLIDAAGRVGSRRLPEYDYFGLSYRATVVDDRVCATYCADVSVVCAPVPAIATSSPNERLPD